MKPDELVSNSASSSRQVLAPTLCFLSAFVVATILIGKLMHSVPYGYGEVLQEKVERLSRSADEDVFFLGTSHVYRGVDPQILEGVFTENGTTARAYNAGLFRQSNLEAMLLLERIVAKKRLQAKPWYLLLEPSLRDWNPTNWLAEREVALHNSTQTRAEIVRHLGAVRQAESTFKRLRHIGGILSHLGSGLAHQLNYGRANSVVFPNGSAFSERFYQAPRLDGFRSLDEEKSQSVLERKRVFERDQSKFGQLVRDENEKRSNSDFKPSPETVRMYQEMCEKVESSGGKLIFLATPRYSLGQPFFGDELEAIFSYPGTLESIPILDYRYSNDNSGLFRPSYWFDSEHLNQEGAKAFSERLAQDLLEAGYFQHEDWNKR